MTNITLKSSPKIYLWTFFGSSIPTLALIFLFNAVLDPLWHFNGNLISGVNYAFNERHMKVNYFINNESDYDCILFGSSRATLINADEIKNYHCFNMSFSNGHIDEFLIIANYMKNRNLNIKKIIFSVNEASFTPYYSPNIEDIPAFLTKDNAGPSPLQDYLTASSLRFSYLTLRNRSPLPRAYKKMDSDSFSGFVISKFNYKPEKVMFSHPDLFKPYQVDNISKYKNLIEMFPNAVSMGFIAPLSNWEQSRIYLMGNLREFLDIRYSLGQIFTQGIIDFSIPTKLTSLTNNTYDGLHYNADVNRMMLNRLNNIENDFGLQIQQVTREKYIEMVHPVIKQFSLDNQLKIVHRN